MKFQLLKSIYRNAKEGNARTNSKCDSLRYEYDDHYFMTDPQVNKIN